MSDEADGATFETDPLTGMYPDSVQMWHAVNLAKGIRTNALGRTRAEAMDRLARDEDVQWFDDLSIADVVIQIVADGAEDSRESPPPKNPAAVALGKLGASKGGKARAAALSPERRSEIARQGGEARWADWKRCACKACECQNETQGTLCKNCRAGRHRPVNPRTARADEARWKK